jgi:opacity protein-like surface antigen
MIMATKTKLSALALAATFTTTLAACSATQDVNTAQEAISHFHEMLSAGQFEQIYALTDDSLKKTTTDRDMERILSTIERKLGAVKASESNGWNIGYTPSGTSITLRYQTQFEHGTGTETFRYRLGDGKALLVGYNVNSNDLFMN